MDFKKIIGFSLGPIGSALLAGITLPLLAWLFPPEDIGGIAILQVATNLAIIVSCLGLDQAYVRNYHGTEKENRQKLLSGMMLPGSILLIISLSTVLIYSPHLISRLLFSIESSWISAGVALCFLSAFVNRFFGLALRMQENSHGFSFSQILPKLIFLIFISFLFFFAKKASFELLLIAHFTATITSSAIIGWITRDKWLPIGTRKISSKEELTNSLKFGMPLVVAGIASWGVFALDRMFLKNISGLDELGIYSIAVSMAATAGIAINIFNTVWTPTAYKWQEEGKSLENYTAVTSNLLAISTIIFMGTGVFSGLFLLILPDEYSEVRLLITACIAAPIFYGLSEATSVGIGINRKSHYSMYASILSLMAGIIGCLAFIPKLGATGAAISTAASIWLFMILRTEFSCYVWRSQPRRSLYFWTFIMMVMLSAYALTGEKYELHWIATWVTCLFISLLNFRSKISSAISSLKNLFSQNKLKGG